MEKYYVSGCRIGDGGMERCDDSGAQSWTLYVRDEDGLSQGIIDCEFREDAEAAMAVYVERDALQEQVQKLAAENVEIKRTILEVANGSEECEFNGDEHRYVVIPEDFDALIDLMGEVPNTDAVIREIGAKAVGDLATEFGLIAQASKTNSIAYRAAKSAVFKCVAVAAKLRAGDQP